MSLSIGDEDPQRTASERLPILWVEQNLRCNLPMLRGVTYTKPTIGKAATGRVWAFCVVNDAGGRASQNRNTELRSRPSRDWRERFSVLDSGSIASAQRSPYGLGIRGPHCALRLAYRRKAQLEALGPDSTVA